MVLYSPLVDMIFVILYYDLAFDKTFFSYNLQTVLHHADIANFMLHKELISKCI